MDNVKFNMGFFHSQRTGHVRTEGISLVNIRSVYKGE